MGLKILIWDYDFEIKNQGGPAGYLYNIREGIKNQKTNIYFIKDVLGHTSSAVSLKSSKIKKWFKSKNILGSYTLYALLNEFKTWSKNISDKCLDEFDFDAYDIIHFHSALALRTYYPFLKNYKGKVMLTSHSPQPLSHERLDLITTNRLIRKLVNPFLELKEIRAWEYADFLMFPVPDAIEVYFDSNIIKDYYNTHLNKFIFCPTSILSYNYDLKKINIRNKLNIPKTAFIVCYIGRHNIVKGYDKLKELGEFILNKYNDVYFLIGGAETRLKGLDNPRWIELGWIDFGNELIAQSDLFILPNKKTYFDLVTLEVIRSGTPILMTRTGGNKFFEQIGNTEGIFFYDYDNLEEAIENFNKIYTEYRYDESLRLSNRKLFENQFTIDKYVKRYTELIIQISNKSVDKVN